MLQKYGRKFDLYSNLFKDFEFVFNPPVGKTGGVQLFIRKDLNPVHLPDMKTQSSSSGLYETVWTKISCNSVKFLISGYYRYPNTSVTDFLSALTETLDKVKSKKRCYV